MRPATGTFLCALKDLPLGASKGITFGDKGDKTNYFELILWHHSDGIKAFENACPHLGTPLETFPDKFLNTAGTALICSTHGAQFDPMGFCFIGPCKNKSLPAMSIQLKDGNILLA